MTASSAVLNRPGPPTSGRGERLRRAYLGTPVRIAITLLFLVGVAIYGPRVMNWLLVDATFFGNAELCRSNGGACWAFIVEKFNLIIFGAYPPRVAVASNTLRRNGVWNSRLWAVHRA